MYTRICIYYNRESAESYVYQIEIKPSITSKDLLQFILTNESIHLPENDDKQESTQNTEISAPIQQEIRNVNIFFPENEKKIHPSRKIKKGAMMKLIDNFLTSMANKSCKTYCYYIVIFVLLILSG